MLALLPHMLEHFDEPDEFSKTCAHNIVQVIQLTVNLHNTVLSAACDLLDTFTVAAGVSLVV